MIWHSFFASNLLFLLLITSTNTILLTCFIMVVKRKGEAGKGNITIFDLDRFYVGIMP